MIAPRKPFPKAQVEWSGYDLTCGEALALESLSEMVSCSQLLDTSGLGEDESCQVIAKYIEISQALLGNNRVRILANVGQLDDYGKDVLVRIIEGVDTKKIMQAQWMQYLAEHTNLPVKRFNPEFNKNPLVREILAQAKKRD